MTHGRGDLMASAAASKDDWHGPFAVEGLISAAMFVPVGVLLCRADTRRTE